jgi:hypothetical protein
MTIEEAKDIDLVDYLSSLGHQPEKINSFNYWYLSPFREEKTPSFKVNRKINRWYEWGGEGARGGNLVDFGILYHHCNVRTLLQRLDNNFSSLVQLDRQQIVGKRSDQTAHSIRVLSSHYISSYPLVSYLRERKIADDIADTYLREVRYQNGSKTFYALGFKNDLGGYGLRSRNFKGCCSPKGVTYIEKGAGDLAVFEGFFDFLSYCTMYYKQAATRQNFLILNSASFFTQNLPRMASFEEVHLFLDNDKAGDRLTQQAIGINNDKFLDERHIYQGHKDLNEWLVKCFLRPRQRQNP